MFLRLRKRERQVLRGRGYPTPGIRSRLYVKGGDAPVMATVCHGPLGRGPMSSLSSFRTTLVEKVSRLFPCVFSHPGPRRGVLELSFCSPFTGPAQPHAPNVTGPIQAEGMNGLLKEYHRESRPNCFNYTAATLMLSTFNMDAINQCDNSHWGGKKKKHTSLLPSSGVYSCQNRAGITECWKKDIAAADAALPSCGQRFAWFFQVFTRLKHMQFLPTHITQSMTGDNENREGGGI